MVLFSFVLNAKTKADVLVDNDHRIFQKVLCAYNLMMTLLLTKGKIMLKIESSIDIRL